MKKIEKIKKILKKFGKFKICRIDNNIDLIDDECVVGVRIENVDEYVIEKVMELGTKTNFLDLDRYFEDKLYNGNTILVDDFLSIVNSLKRYFISIEFSKNEIVFEASETGMSKIKVTLENENSKECRGDFWIKKLKKIPLKGLKISKNITINIDRNMYMMIKDNDITLKIVVAGENPY